MQSLLYCTRSPAVTLISWYFWPYSRTHTHTHTHTHAHTHANTHTQSHAPYFQFQSFSLSTTPAESAYAAMATTSQQREDEGWEGERRMDKVEKLSWVSESMKSREKVRQRAMVDGWNSERKRQWKEVRGRKMIKGEQTSEEEWRGRERVHKSRLSITETKAF